MHRLTVFNDRVKTLAPAQPVGDRKALHMALARVILLSDGNANVGDTTDIRSQLLSFPAP